MHRDGPNVKNAKDSFGGGPGDTDSVDSIEVAKVATDAAE